MKRAHDGGWIARGDECGGEANRGGGATARWLREDMIGWPAWAVARPPTGDIARMSPHRGGRESTNGATRSTVSCNMVRSLISRRNCLGVSCVLSGQRRVPLPPARMDAYISLCFSTSSDISEHDALCASLVRVLLWYPILREGTSGDWSRKPSRLLLAQQAERASRVAEYRVWIVLQSISKSTRKYPWIRRFRIPAMKPHGISGCC